MSRDRFFIEKKMQPETFPVETVDFSYFSDKEMCEAYEEFLFQRRMAIEEVQKNTKEVKAMFEDTRALLHNQQPPVDAILKNIDETKKISGESVKKNIEEAEEKQKRWCLVM